MAIVVVVAENLVGCEADDDDKRIAFDLAINKQALNAVELTLHIVEAGSRLRERDEQLCFRERGSDGRGALRRAGAHDAVSPD